MRILHVVSALAAGGAEIFVKDLCLSLAESGHSMAIAFISSAHDQGNDPKIEEQFKSDLVAGNVSVFEIGHVARNSPLRGARRLGNIVKQFQPDVLHIHLGRGLVFRSLMFSRIPTIYTHHNILFKFGPILTACFDRFIFSYVAICKSCEELLGRRTSRPVTLIRNGISKRRVAPQDSSRGNHLFKVVSVGRISAQKNYRSIILIAKICTQHIPNAEAHIRFQICGDGADIETMRDAARAEGVDDIVHFLGGRTDVPELMAASDVLLMTSIFEGMPITLIEAAHAGLPMIATDVGGCNEIARHGENGFIFTPNDNEVAAASILKLFRNPVLCRQFSAKSLEIAEDFGMEKVSILHLALYEKLLRNKIKKAN